MNLAEAMLKLLRKSESVLNKPLEIGQRLAGKDSARMVLVRLTIHAHRRKAACDRLRKEAALGDTILTNKPWDQDQ